MSKISRSRTSTDRIKQAMAADDPTSATVQSAVESMRRMYIQLDRDTEVSRALKSLVEHAISVDDQGDRFEGKVLTVMGPSRAGKTALLKEAFRDLKGFDDYSERAGTMLPLLSVEAYRPASARALPTSILKAMGVPYALRIAPRVAWDMVRANLELRQVVLLHVDEAQHLLRDDDEQSQLARDQIKGLTQGRWPVSLILSGLPSLKDFVGADTQIMGRSEYFTLDSLHRQNDKTVISTILSELVERAGLVTSFPEGYDVLDRLGFAGSFHVGRIVKIVIRAAEEALGSGSRHLGIAHLVASLQAITLCGDDRNTFLASRYELLLHWPDDPKRSDTRLQANAEFNAQERR